jgi:hypothetical protein
MQGGLCDGESDGREEFIVAMAMLGCCTMKANDGVGSRGRRKCRNSFKRIRIRRGVGWNAGGYIQALLGKVSGIYKREKWIKHQ